MSLCPFLQKYSTFVRRSFRSKIPGWSSSSSIGAPFWGSGRGWSSNWESVDVTWLASISWDIIIGSQMMWLGWLQYLEILPLVALWEAVRHQCATRPQAVCNTSPMPTHLNMATLLSTEMWNGENWYLQNNNNNHINININNSQIYKSLFHEERVTKTLRYNR